MMRMWLIPLSWMIIPVLFWHSVRAQTSTDGQTNGTCENVCRQCARSGQVSELQSRVIAMENRNDYLECDVESLREGITRLEERDPVFRDCREVFLSEQTLGGSYRIQPNGSVPFMAVCEFDYDGQWTVIQRRVDGDISFDRNWEDYKRGFGRLGYSSTFWLGLEKIHHLTQQQAYILRIELTDWDGNKAYADYSGFEVENESTEYTLRYTSYIGGTAGDALSNRMPNGHNHNGQKFTTKDRDNDEAGHNCAVEYNGGWWYMACFKGNLNGGSYLKAPNHTSSWHGIQWPDWKGKYSLMHSTMMIRPSN